MIPESPSLAIQTIIEKTLQDVFSKMLSLDVQPVQGQPRLDHPARVVGMVGIAGTTVTGAVFLHVSASLSRQIAAAMLGLNDWEIHEGEQVWDVVSEITNMIAGCLKSRLCDSGFFCAISTPSIVRGPSFQIETAPDIRPRDMYFSCGPEIFLVAVHLKFKEPKSYADQSTQRG